MSRITRALTLAGRVPTAVWRPLWSAGAELASLRPPKALRQWQLNAGTLTGSAPDRRQTAAAGRSWARNLVESAQLGHWSHERILRDVLVSEQDRARLAAARARGGMVAALPHMGSWDLAGAWACLNDMPVSTVAEQLPDDEFAWFVSVREALGFRVHGHRESHVVDRLVEDCREGRLVCLVSDRKLGAGGVPVAWPVAGGEVPVRMPAGAATVTLRTGATLFGVASHYEGSRMRLVVSQEIHPRAGAVDPVLDMNQQLADFFSEQARAHVTDWHMLQRFFPDVVAT